MHNREKRLFLQLALWMRIAQSPSNLSYITVATLVSWTKLGTDPKIISLTFYGHLTAGEQVWWLFRWNHDEPLKLHLMLGWSHFFSFNSFSFFLFLNNILFPLNECAVITLHRVTRKVSLSNCGVQPWSPPWQLERLLQWHQGLMTVKCSGFFVFPFLNQKCEAIFFTLDHIIMQMVTNSWKSKGGEIVILCTIQRLHKIRSARPIGCSFQKNFTHWNKFEVEADREKFHKKKIKIKVSISGR